MHTKNIASACLAVTLLGAAATNRTAEAAAVSKLTTQTGPSSCAPALPAFEGVIRKRPLAIQNEGTSSSFITCSLPTTLYSSSGTSTNAYLGLINNSADPVNVTCTLVDAIAGATTPVYITKMTTVNANGLAEISWSASDDNAGTPFKFSPNMSCNLQPGVGISYTGSRFQDEIGS